VWVLAVVFGVFLFVYLLLTIPFDVTFYVEKDANFKSRVRVGWMFNLIGRDFNLTGRDKKRKKKPEKEKPKKKRSVKPFIAMLRARGFQRRLLRFIRDIFGSLHVRELRAYLRIGLNDPADTGMLFATVAPAVVHLRAFTPLDVQILPDFEQEGLRGYLKGRLRFFPIQIITVMSLFALSPATIRAIMALALAWRR